MLPTTNAFTVTFNSTNPGQGAVYFGSGPGCTGLVNVATRDSGAGTTSHTVVVMGNDLPGTVGDIGLLATKVDRGDDEVEGYHLLVGGGAGAERTLAREVYRSVPADAVPARIEAILRSVLRAGAYELQKRIDIPARVIVSEYVDVAHAFVDKTETGMVNAVLERLARDTRAGEFG